MRWPWNARLQVPNLVYHGERPRASVPVLSRSPPRKPQGGFIMKKMQSSRMSKKMPTSSSARTLRQIQSSFSDRKCSCASSRQTRRHTALPPQRPRRHMRRIPRGVGTTPYRDIPQASKPISREQPRALGCFAGPLDTALDIDVSTAPALTYKCQSASVN